MSTSSVRIYFNPRSPHGERPCGGEIEAKGAAISIHALLTESDLQPMRSAGDTPNFNPRSPHGERPWDRPPALLVRIFQSTLSSRRATSPAPAGDGTAHISIHALLTESDLEDIVFAYGYDISIHALLTESDVTGVGLFQGGLISIHALLTESDDSPSSVPTHPPYFNPRSPHGERHGIFIGDRTVIFISIHALLTESDSKYHQIGPIVSV